MTCGKVPESSHVQVKSIEQRTMQRHLEWVLWERTLGTGEQPWVGKSRQILRAEGGLRALPQEVMWAGVKREKAPHPVRLCISFGLGS